MINCCTADFLVVLNQLTTFGAKRTKIRNSKPLWDNIMVVEYYSNDSNSLVEAIFW